MSTLLAFRLSTKKEEKNDIFIFISNGFYIKHKNNKIE